MGDSLARRRWPEPPAGERPLPGVRLWRALRGLRRRGLLSLRRLGCGLLAFGFVAIAGLLLLDRAVDGIGAMFGDESRPVPGSPFDAVAPSTPPSSGSERIDLVTQRGRLIVGVQRVPGLVERDPATREYSGFDVALAGRVARELGVDPSDTAFKVLPAGYRETVLVNGEVDLVLGGYAMTAPRQREVGFAGPYLTSPQRLAVPPGGAGADVLERGTICAAEGSPTALSLGRRLGERLLLRDSLSGCSKLLDERVDAIAADELRLDALLAEEPGAVELTGPALGETRYGIGLPPGDEVLAGRVQQLLRAAVEDGSWARWYATHLGTPVPDPPPLQR